MGPKKKRAARPASGSSGGKKKRPRGLLGVASAGYNSESDEDYSPGHTTTTTAAVARAAARGEGNRQRAVARAAAAAAPPDSSSDSDEPLSVRQQRRSVKAGLVSAAAAGRANGSSRRQHSNQPPASSWDDLPAAVLAQIFTTVCKHNTLPMAPRLACVCSTWRAAVDATPELWRVLDTAAVPGRAWVATAAGAGSGGSGKGRQQGKSGAKGRHAAANRLTAEEGLSRWASSGRLQQLQALLLYADGVGGSSADDPGSSAAAAAAAGDGGGAGGVNRQPSAGLLMQIAHSCQQLQRVSLFGAWSLRPEEVSSALLAMPALSELSLCGVRFSAISGLSACLTSVLEAAAATGTPRLKELVVESCPSLTHKAVTALCPPPAGQRPQPGSPQQPAQAAAAAAGGGPSAAAAGGASSAAAAAPAAAAAFAHLEVLDLSNSGRSGFRLQLDDMQAAMPRLRVLKLSGLGGLYGWRPVVRNDRAALPGFPALEALHVDVALAASQNGIGMPHTGTSFVTDAVLQQLAGNSLQLSVLDLSGTPVTPRGMRNLAMKHAEHRLAETPGAGGASSSSGGSGGSGGSSVQQRAQHASGLPAAEGVAASIAAVAAEVARVILAAEHGDGLRIRDLQLDGSSLACDDGLDVVGVFCHNTLEQLVVRNAGSKLADDGIAQLCLCQKLASLDITGCSVTEAGLRKLLSQLPAGVLEELHLESCRGVSREARQAAARGVDQLRAYFAEHATAE